MAEPPTLPAQAPQEPPRPRCANCGAELHGPYCHQCGQSTRHVLKHVPALVHDGLDLFFDIDGRILRTLPALFLRPGFLAREYFAGRRTRYIPPFRLMFFLSLLAFLVMQFNLNLNPDALVVRDTATIQGDTPAEVRANLHKAEQDLADARAQPGTPALADAALAASQRALRESANQRLRQLGAPPLETPASPATPASLSSTAEGQHYLDSIRDAPDAATLKQRRASARADIEAALARPGLAPAASAQLESLRGQVDAAASQRGAELEHDAAPASAASVIASGMPRKVHITWLPAFLNQAIDHGLERARANITAIKTGTSKRRNETLRRIRAEAFSVLPQVLFVMLPLFAVLLKIVYLFKRRLYVEHLIVAMYSHAFLYLSLLLVGLLALLKDVTPAWTGNVLGWIAVAILAWIPVYLLLMQKRVYAQGWTMTLLKYALLGVCYSVLVSCAVASAALIGIAS